MRNTYRNSRLSKLSLKFIYSLLPLKYPSSFERLDHSSGLFVVWVFSYFVVFCFHLSCVVFFLFVFFFIRARGLSENWRYCSVTSSDSVTPRRFSTTPTTRCCLGCGPTAPPTCRGTGTHPATSHSLTVHPDRWQKVNPCSCTHTHTHTQTRTFNRCTKKIQVSGAFLHGRVVCLTMCH